MLVHASCVAIDGRGVLLRGPSGAGKSDLALRLIDGGARLVADDQVELAAEGGQVIARPPAALAGLIEARGVGIVKVGFLAEASLALVAELAPSTQIERLPERETAQICGIALPMLKIDPFPASAPAKIKLALAVAAGNAESIMRPR